MLEKTGMVTLTEEELIQIKMGTLPERLNREWSLTLEELKTIIQTNRYQVSGVENK